MDMRHEKALGEMLSAVSDFGDETKNQLELTTEFWHALTVFAPLFFIGDVSISHDSSFESMRISYYPPEK